mgnify:CR=1 FL=1
MKIDCDRVLILSDRLAQLSNVYKRQLKRYGIALRRIVALYAKGESSICDIMENGSGTQYVFACTLDTDVLNDLYMARIDIPQISLKAE